MKVVLTFTTMIAFTVVANLLLKAGATAASSSGASVLMTFLNWRTIAGLASFGVAGLLYAVVLRWLPLNVAQSFAAAQFVAVILASLLVLGERATTMQLAGIFLIALGIAFVGWTQH